MAPKASKASRAASSSAGKVLPSDLIKKFKSVVSYRGNTPEMEALHDAYRQGDFDKKLKILTEFQKDSKCSWVTSFLAEEKEVEKTENKTMTFWKSRRQIAAIQCLDEKDPEQKAELEAILDSMYSELLGPFFCDFVLYCSCFQKACALGVSKDLGLCFVQGTKILPG